MLYAACGRQASALSGLLLLSLSLPALAQMRHTTAPNDPHQHVFAIVPIIGTGTIADPKRPMFAPSTGIKPNLPVAGASFAKRTGIIGFHSEPTDDGKSAIVEFIAPSLTDLQEILHTTDSRVQFFIRGVHGKDVMETAFKAQKKSFSFDRFVLQGAR